MPDGYEILFRPEVADDLAALGRDQRRRVLDALAARLTIQPEAYGKPLGGQLAGLRRLRVGDFRIAYQIAGRRVIVWAAIDRKTIYRELSKRWSLA